MNKVLMNGAAVLLTAALALGVPAALTESFAAESEKPVDDVYETDLIPTTLLSTTMSGTPSMVMAAPAQRDSA